MHQTVFERNAFVKRTFAKNLSRHVGLRSIGRKRRFVSKNFGQFEVDLRSSNRCGPFLKGYHDAFEWRSPIASHMTVVALGTANFGGSPACALC